MTCIASTQLLPNNNYCPIQCPFLSFRSIETSVDWRHINRRKSVNKAKYGRAIVFGKIVGLTEPTTSICRCIVGLCLFRLNLVCARFLIYIVLPCRRYPTLKQWLTTTLPTRILLIRFIL